MSPSPAPPRKPNPKARPESPLPALLAAHGDLLHDLAVETLQEPERAAKAVRKIFRSVARGWIPDLRGEFERPWLIRIAVETLRQETAGRSVRVLLGAESLTVRPGSSLPDALRSLPFEARILILLADKHAVPFSEIAIALRQPEASLRTAHQLARSRIDPSLRPETIPSLPKSPLPPELSAHPLRDPAHRLSLRSIFRRSSWKKAPWYWRSGLETLTIGLVAFGVVASAPTIRDLYEKGISRRLEGFDLAWVPSSEPPATAEDEEAPPPAAEEQDEFADETEPQAGAPNDALAKPGRPLAVGPSEIWRMNLAVESPTAMRARVIELLKSVGVPADNPGLSGFTAPGGIQFDLLVPRTTILPAKEKLEALAIEAAETAVTRPARDPFAWYRHRARRPIPEGRARLVIWLSP